MANFIGRRVGVGFGVEATRGTPVAPTYFFRQTALDFSRKVKSIEDKSAMYRMEDSVGSAITEQWGEGKLDGNVGDLGIGYLLANIFGANPVDAAHGTETTVYDHTYSIAQTNTPLTHTIARVDANSSRRHAFGTFKDLELDCKVGEWVSVTSNIIADKGVTSTDNPVYVEENRFTSKHINVKLAASQAGLAAAATIKGSNLKVKIDRKSAPYYGFNGVDPANYFAESYTLTGEVDLTYDDQTYENLYYNNTQQYLQVAIVNTDVTIGTASNPTLTLNMPQAKITGWTMTNALDTVVEQHLIFTMELNVAAGMAVQAILTNTKANYTT